ncbi:hypothetical protein DGG96_09080 [Legionella qingyii]|uniref:Uncharacterized protein n=1 Tax=Legionella qingyii TaxID=2184757 RepID=A0A317U4Y0_9GAMM|nr:hypothetical protein [Legionella qingyii]PWY55887.1 hypothetical protein DGG96_09080 [Legionella qingyii]RUR22462.1 hypothetical protein ELY20_09195 [Legionella qingyii]RUR27934.1 hypothetical protein ELY16_03930 [Legionella qingyii]
MLQKTENILIWGNIWNDLTKLICALERLSKEVHSYASVLLEGRTGNLIKDYAEIILLVNLNTAACRGIFY